MIWLTWRQFRAQTLVAAAVLAALAIVLGLTGPHLLAVFNAAGVADCHAQGDCAAATTSFANQVKGSTYDELLFFGCLAVIYAAPALMGVFWGAPLVTREIEAGTFRLAWNQGVTRRRWLLTKLGLIGLAAMATAGLLSLMYGWWASPVYQAAAAAAQNPLNINKMAPQMFGATGIVPIGYAAFAFALGVAAGVLIRRTLPAMAATLAVFAAVQVAWPTWIRPHLVTPATVTVPFNPANAGMMSIQNNNQMTVIESVQKPGAWILSSQTVTPSGHPFTGPATSACLSGSAQQCNAWLASKHLRAVISYQPAARYWTFQWDETGIFLAAAVALAAFCYWRIRRSRA